MLPVRGRCFLQHLRLGTAEVSLHHIFGWVIGGCRSSSLTVSERGPPKRTDRTTRYPQPTDPVSVMRTPVPGPRWLGPPFRTPGFLFLRPLSLTSCTDPGPPRLFLDN